MHQADIHRKFVFVHQILFQEVKGVNLCDLEDGYHTVPEMLQALGFKSPDEADRWRMSMFSMRFCASKISLFLSCTCIGQLLSFIRIRHHYISFPETASQPPHQGLPKIG